MNIVVYGATSAIIKEVLRNFAKEGHSFYLVARNKEKLEIIENDLKARGAASVQSYISDLMQVNEQKALADKIISDSKSIDLLLVGHGTLLDQEKCKIDPELALKEVCANYTSFVAILTSYTECFRKQNSGQIAVISSVAGDRGRASNYVYGSTKAGVSAFVDGLRHSFATSGVAVTLIKPGIVNSPMTKHLGVSGPTVAEPEKVGRDIYKGIKKKKDTIYTPSFGC